MRSNARPPWKLALALCLTGAVFAIPLVAKAITTVGASVTAKRHSTPLQLSTDLDRGRHVVFERTGTTRQVGPVSTSNSGPPTLTTEGVQVRDPSGERVPVRYDQANETITQGNAIYTGVLIFDAEQDGTYEISITSAGQEVLISRSLGETFRELGPPFLFALAGAPIFLAGIVSFIVGLSRRRTAGDPATAPSSAPVAGWYPDPQRNGQRYWDGTNWTEHTAP